MLQRVLQPIVLSAGAGSLSSGSLIFSNSNGVTFGINGHTLTASHNGLTSQLGQALSGSNGSFTFQTATFGNANNFSFLTSNGSMVGSFSQSNQSAIKGFGASNTGNTAGNTGLSTGIDWVLAGSNNVTVSESTAPGGPNTLWISGPTVGGAQTGISGISNSETMYTSGTIKFSGSNMVTVRSTTGQAFVFDATQTVQTQAITVDQVSMGVSTGGNTSGNTTVQTGNRFVLVGSNGITLSQGTGAGSTTITISGITQSNQPAINALGVSNTGNTAGNTGTSSGITWVLAASNGITASQSTAGGGPNTIWLSGATQTVQTQAITVDQVSIGVSTGGNTSGNTTVNTGNRFVLVGTNGITLSQGTGAGSTTVTISGITQSNQPAINALGVSNTGNTAGNTGTSSGITWVLAASNGITASQSTAGGGPNTIWLSGATQTNQSAIKAFGASNTGNTAGNTGVSTGIDWVLAGTNGITISESTAGGGPNTLWVSGATQTVESQSIGVSNLGNTLGTSGVASGGQVRFVLVASDGMIASQSLNGASATVSLQNSWSTATTVSQVTNGNVIGVNAARFALEGHQHAGVPALAAGSNTGNTLGNTGTQFGSWVIAGTNNITVSGSTGAGGIHTVWLSGQSPAGGAFSGGVSTGGNTAGATGITGTQLVFVGVGVVSLSQTTGANGGTLSIAVPATSSLSATGWVSISTNGSTISIGASTTMNLYASSNTVGTSSGTADMRSISIAGQGLVSVAASNSGWNISVDPKVNLFAVGNTFGTSSGTADDRTLSISFGSGIVGAASNSGWVIGQQVVSFFEPTPFNGGPNSASSTGGFGTLQIQPFIPSEPLAINQLNIIGSMTLTSTTAGNTFSFSNTGANSFRFVASFSNSNSVLFNVYLFSKGTGAFSSNLQTWGSTQNSFVTFQTHIYDFSVTNGAGSTGSFTLVSTVSLVVSFPGITSTTSTSINAATTVTVWGTGYTSWTSSQTTSTTNTYNSTTTGSTNIAGTWPATTAWSSYKMIPIQFSTSMLPGEYWMGIQIRSSTSSNSASATSNVGAGKTYTSTVNASNLTLSAQLTMLGFTNTIVSSLGWMGLGSTSTLGPAFAHGSFTATYDPTVTFVNNAGQPAGAIAITDIRSNVSFFRTWFQMASNRF